MKTRQYEAETKSALGLLHSIKFTAYAERRACAKSGNPFEPIPGMESDFEKAGNTIHKVNFLLGELDKRVRFRKTLVSIVSKTLESLVFVLIKVMTLDFETIKLYYSAGAWDKAMVAKAVAKSKITAAQYKEITGDDYAA